MSSIENFLFRCNNFDLDLKLWIKNISWSFFTTLGRRTLIVHSGPESKINPYIYIEVAITAIVPHMYSFVIMLKSR